MDRSTTLDGNLAAGNNAANPVNTKLEGAAQVAHNTTDQFADKAVAPVDRVSAKVHHAIDDAADAAKSAARWASTLPDQAQEVRTRLTGSARASIRARPIAAVAGALVVGYLLGRLARL
jgi:hypothetical protein